MKAHAYFNRQTILDAYINRILDEMDIKDLIRIVGDYYEENFSEYTDEQLTSEIQDRYPELYQQLKDIQLSLNSKLNTYEPDLSAAQCAN
jgi:ATP-dependent Zn protease